MHKQTLEPSPGQGLQDGTMRHAVDEVHLARTKPIAQQGLKNGGGLEGVFQHSLAEHHDFFGGFTV